jgi:hypothetical protein
VCSPLGLLRHIHTHTHTHRHTHNHTPLTHTHTQSHPQLTHTHTHNHTPLTHTHTITPPTYTHTHTHTQQASYLRPWLTNSMEQRPSWEANSFSASQEIPLILWNLDVHYVRMFRNIIHFYGKKLLAPRPTPKLEDHPLSAVRDCLFSVFAATLHNWMQFLHPQPQDAPWRGASDAINTCLRPYGS